MQRNVTARILALVLCLACGPVVACSPSFWGGAAVGAVGTGAAYERQNAKAMRELDRSFKRGEITKEEYLKRKEEIEKNSVVR